MLVKTLRISNFLSFGEKQVSVELGKLNVLIGPNGSGKSNLLNVFQIAFNAPSRISDAFVLGNSPSFEWFHKSKSDKPNEQKSIRIEYDVALEVPKSNVRDYTYSLEFGLENSRIKIVDEKVEGTNRFKETLERYFYYKFQNGHPVLNFKNNSKKERKLNIESIDKELSILSQKKDLDELPEITILGQKFKDIQIYSDWVFGKQGVLRNSGRPDLPSKYLATDFSNLPLIISRIKNAGGKNYQDFVSFIKLVYEGIEEINIHVDYGTVKLFIMENGISISASRLSDGTLRFIALGAILFNPTPPPLVCIEEPELGLHPDLISSLAEALKAASERMQIIITTHSADLVSCFSDQPESVIVAEKQDGVTHLERQNAEDLAPWLEKYRLGELWIRGDIGGNRW